MYKESSFSELIEHQFIYQYFTDKLDIPAGSYNKPIAVVCEEQHLNGSLIQVLLKTYDETLEFPYAELSKFGIREILNYLKLTHRYYLTKKLPEIEQTILHLSEHYKNSHQLLVMLCLFFVDYKKKLEEHIRYEESYLFPYIENLVKGNLHRDSATLFSAKVFSENHTDIESDLHRVRQTILKFTGSQKTPLPYNVFLSQLHYFEIDLCKHATIEDEVLIPMVMRLEEELMMNSR